MSVREQAIIAIVERLGSIGTFTVARNEVVPSAVGEGGHVVVRDGERESSEPTLGVRSYWITHRVSVEAIAGGADPDGALEALLAAIQQVLLAEPTLGGTVAVLTCDLADVETVAADGAAALKSALVDVIIEYETANPLD